MRLTYGSYVAGYGQDRRHVEGFVRVGPAGPDVVEVAFTIALTCAAPGASNDLEDEVTAFRAAFDVPNQTLLVEMVDTSAGTNLANLVEIDPSASDRNATRVFPHYETDPRGCSQASHVFNVTVRAGRIASYDANHVRATDPVRFEVTAPDNRIRVLRIMGTATATAGAGARLTAIAAVAALRTSLASTLGGTWPTTARNDSYRPDPEDHECAFVAEFKERVVNEAVGTLDHASIGDQQLLVSVSEAGADLGSRQDRPMLGVTASGRYAIDADVTTDLAATWEDVVLPWIEQNMSELAGGGQLYVLEAQPRYDVENNTIMPHVVGVVPGSGRQLFRRIRVTDSVRYGWVFRDTWPTEGDPVAWRTNPGVRPDSIPRMEAARPGPGRAPHGRGPDDVRRRAARDDPIVRAAPAQVGPQAGHDAQQATRSGQPRQGR